MTQLALAWLLAQSDHIVPILGTRSPHHLEGDVASARGALTPRTSTASRRSSSTMTPAPATTKR
ncbi:hypothetical protein [Streptomyces sp. NPDC056255]|uniref:hypothetical protein n=1 Tax=Streptomyces sp. NPDC056255 TaxID=3345764 RepID=UPI0035D55EAC